MLLAVVVMVALVLIALSVAAPVVARDLRRDKELESEHRAQQYTRAIQLYYKKTKTYPASIKALENTNNVRYLRKQYVDPLTGQADWRLIHLGEQKTKIKVFFGEELTGLTAGLGSAAGLQSSGVPAVGGTAGTAGSTSTIGATTALASGFQGASTTISGTAATTGTAGTTGAAGTSGTAGSTSTGSGSGAFGDGTLGVIVGVGPAKSGESILNPNEQTTYETWEFWYDPKIELLRQGVSITGGGISSQSASSFGNNGVTGQPNSGAGSPMGTPGATAPFGTTAPGTTTTPTASPTTVP
jgi:type II secretory pathway pseudopilin PulG